MYLCRFKKILINTSLKKREREREIDSCLKKKSTSWIDFLKCYIALPWDDFNYQRVHYQQSAITSSTLYIEIDLSNTGTRSRRRSSILLRFCRAEYCASPFCHPPAGFQCCNHGDVAFPQGERVKGVDRTYASMERLPLLKLTHVSRIWCRINKTAIYILTLDTHIKYLTAIRI